MNKVGVYLKKKLQLKKPNSIQYCVVYNEMYYNYTRIQYESTHTDDVLCEGLSTSICEHCYRQRRAPPHQ